MRSETGNVSAPALLFCTRTCGWTGTPESTVSVGTTICRAAASTSGSASVESVPTIALMTRVRCMESKCCAGMLSAMVW
jgi:hypothetical protein